MDTAMEFSNAKSTGSAVYNALRRMILAQELKPGERLVEAKVAEMLNVSITPVRQAFSYLNMQDLITTFPYRGSFVTVFSREAAVDLIQTRSILEPAAAELAFPKLDKKDAVYLEKVCEMSDINQSMGRLIECVEYDIMFHDLFFQRCGNKVLCDIWNRMKDKIVSLQCVTKQDCSATEKMLSVRHRDIIDAVATSDLPKLKTALHSHMDYTLARTNLPLEKDINYV